MAVKFGLDQASTPPPKLWRVVSGTSRAMFAGLIVMFQSTTLVSHRIADWIVFFLGVGLLFFQSLDVGLGEHKTNGNGQPQPPSAN